MRSVVVPLLREVAMLGKLRLPRGACGCLVVWLVGALSLAAETRFTSPAENERWAADSLHVIAWEGELAPQRLEWVVDGDPVSVLADEKLTAQGTFLWRVPSGEPRGRLRLVLATATVDAPPLQCVPSQAVDYHWTEITRQAPFAPRDGAGALVYRDQLWFLGGWNPSDKKHFPRICNNEVWSSRDGLAWTLIKPNTFLDQTFDSRRDWEGRHTAGYVVCQDKMWIVGGDVNQGHYHSDVWNSTDGRQWNLVNEKPVPWGPRALHYTVAVKDEIWVIGGQTVPQFAKEREVFYRDVWTTRDGIDWQQKQPREPAWPQRGMIGGGAVFRDRVWLLGGGTYDTPQIPSRKYFNDVWSTADGVDWTQHTAAAPWAPRQYHEVAVFDDRLWVLEGYGGGNRNDVWYSADGVNWYEVPNTPWKPRHAASVYVHDGGLWMVAGNNMQSDVWKLTRKGTHD